MEEWEVTTGPSDRHGQEIHLDPELLKRVKVRAALEGLGLNELISRALKHYLAESPHAP